MSRSEKDSSLIDFSSLDQHTRAVDVGPGELVVILAVVLLLFGPDRVPRLARSLGEAIREFHIAGDDSNADDASDEPLAVDQHEPR